MSIQDIAVLLDEPMQLGECPLWHAGEAALYWIDIPGHAVHRMCTPNGAHRTWALPSEPGCIAFTNSESLLVAMRDGICLLNTRTGELSAYVSAPYDCRIGRFNDGRCDPRGRFWVGTLHDPRDRPGGSLFCLERGTIRDLGKPVTVSNGIAFNGAASTLYHTDTTAHRITAYDFDVDKGTIAGARLFHQFPTGRTAAYGGRPDGAAVDSEDAYWCAMYEGGRILRLSPTGEVMQEISLPVRCPTMVAFGGADLRTLYITTARHNRPEEELARYPLSGCLFALRVEVAGRAEYAYRL
jgi:sugar lactone lactonase YvrE